MKARLGMLSLFLALGSIVAHAQFIGYTSAQSTTSTPYNNVTCTAALTASPVTVRNIGQGGHWATLTGNSGATTLLYTIQGSYDGITFFDISDVGSLPPQSTDIPNITGTGYYPVIGVKVGACTPSNATITIKYGGISLTPSQPVGSAQGGQLNKHLASNLGAGGAYQSGALRTPFGSSAGVLNFIFGSGAGPTGSTLVVTCQTLGTATAALQTFTFPLQTTNSLAQSFNVPPAACPYFNVTYNNGGASANVFSLDYAFAPPGSSPPPYAYTHITGTSATTIKATQGTVHTVSINTGGAGTFTLFDLPAASCTGTPATNQVAIVTSTAATLQTFTYDANFLSGICAKASVAMDVTVSSQ